MIRKFFKDQHTVETMKLAWPIVITQVGHIVTGMVDNLFLGRFGAAEQAAGILSNNILVLVLVFAIGMSYATTPLVTGAFQRNDVLKKASLFKNSLFLNFLVAMVCFIILSQAAPLLKHMKQPDEVVNLSIPYFNVLILSMVPVSFFFTCKQYCEGLSITRMALWISVIGNLLNILLNYLMMYGKMGLPELGYMGAAWASFCARFFMGAAFIIYILKSKHTKEILPVLNKVKVNLRELKDLWNIGFNSSLQFTFEVAAFVVAGLMSGSFGKEQIDAHGIALSIAAFTYMFGNGISSAATIRVGIFKAQNNWVEIKKATITAIKLVVLVMGIFGLLLLSLRHYLPVAFSSEPDIIEMASMLLVIAALFQMFDGMQVTIIGILRGLEDVKTATAVTITGYWLICLPLAYFLAFTMGLQTIGIWIALLTSLVFVAFGLGWRLNYLVKKNSL